MALLPELNKTATAANVRDFFHKQWPRYLNRAGTTVNMLKSPSFDPMPKSPSFENSQEIKMMNIFDAQQSIACVMETIRSCREQHSRVLIYSFIDCLTDWKIAQKMGYSDSQEQRIKLMACCEFAERLTYFQAKWDTDLPDMQSFEKEGNDS